MSALDLIIIASTLAYKAEARDNHHASDVDLSRESRQLCAGNTHKPAIKANISAWSRPISRESGPAIAMTSFVTNHWH